MKKKSTQKIATLASTGALFLALVSPVFAIDLGAEANLNLGVNTNGTTTPGTGVRTFPPKNSAEKGQKIAEAQARLNTKATTAIKKRVDSLNELEARLGEMKHVSDATKTSLSASISATINDLNTLSTKIAGDTTAAELKTDTASIAKNERVFMLVEPIIKISAAADRATTVAGMLTDVSAKIQSRITEAQTAGKDVTAVVALQADMTAKIADAKTQAAAALSLVSGLTPDGGDTAKLQANNTALKTARKDIETANKDLKIAQGDFDKIIKTLAAKAPKVRKEARENDSHESPTGAAVSGTTGATVQ